MMDGWEVLFRDEEELINLFIQEEMNEMARHELTQEERRRGGQNRAKLPDFSEHCKNAYQMLQIKRPGVALYIYRQKIAPYMADKENK